MQYADLLTTMAAYLQQEQPSNAYTTALPTLINKAELRIYRSLELASTSSVNSSLVFTPGSRELALVGMTGQTLNGLPVQFPYPVTVQGLTAIVPAWQAPMYGGRVRFQPVSFAFLDMCWPNEAVTAVPGTIISPVFAIFDDQTLLVAPTPDQQYTAEVSGTWRPAPMSATNPISWIGDHLPDLLIDAVMVESYGWMRDYGQQSDDPRSAVSWEQRFQQDLVTARDEETRRAIGRPPPVGFPMVAPSAAPQGPAQ